MSTIEVTTSLEKARPNLSSAVENTVPESHSTFWQRSLYSP
ncbi:hypothetical protein EBR78_05385 [bacterium]|nr:hypothetical protein [bacterium]NBX83696.1 hypothetical protein [bacterium]